MVHPPLPDILSLAQHNHRYVQRAYAERKAMRQQIASIKDDLRQAAESLRDARSTLKRASLYATRAEDFLNSVVTAKTDGAP